MKVIECPMCDNPVSGKECQECGVNPHKTEFKDCSLCGQTKPTGEIETIRTRTDDFGNVSTRYLCNDCT